MEINGSFNPISAKRARDLMGVTAELAGKFDKTGGNIAGVATFQEQPWYKEYKLWHEGNLKLGRGIGNIVALEAGAGAPTIVTDGLEFRPSKTVSYANVAIMKDIPIGADPGPANQVVSTNLLVQTDIRESTRAFNWNALFKVNIDPTAYRKYEHGDEPVALGASLQRNADIPAWCFYTSTYDTTSNPIYPVLGWEKGLSVNGPDPNNVRIMIDMQLNSIDDRPGFNKYGQNEIGCVMNISPSLGEAERVIAKKGIQFKGRVGHALFMADTTDYSRENIVFPGDGYMSWRDRTFKDGNGRDVSGARLATFGWNGQAGTFQFGGMRNLPTADDNVEYLEVQINGATRYIRAYKNPV